MKNELAYYVYVENFNSKKIEPYNVLSDHIVNTIKTKTKGISSKELFAQEVKSVLMYNFWSKCEWEIVITDWPTHIETEEVIRLQKEIDDYFECWNRKPYSIGVRLRVAEKIDVYDQVLLNWDIFIDYLWNNLRGAN